MPYIKSEDREALDLGGERPINAGELNYSISKMIVTYVLKNGLSYQHINDVIGALEGAKAEFQRRIVGPYEDKKILENGDLNLYSVLTQKVHKETEGNY